MDSNNSIRLVIHACSFRCNIRVEYKERGGDQVKFCTTIIYSNGSHLPPQECEAIGKNPKPHRLKFPVVSEFPQKTCWHCFHLKPLSILHSFFFFKKFNKLDYPALCFAMHSIFNL